MSFSQSQILAMFKNFGKIIYAAQASQATALAYQQAMLNLNRQFADSADPTDNFSYNVLFYHDVNFQSNWQALIAQELNGAVLAKEAMDNYLDQLGPDLGNNPNDTPSAIAARLALAMIPVSGWVSPSGANDQYHNFQAYFWQNYGVVLPASGTPIVLDAWITTTVV